MVKRRLVELRRIQMAIQPKTRIGPYTRRIKGKIYKVKRHTRYKRMIGKRPHYTKIGTFFVAHDKYGNFKGSKVIPFKRKSTKLT